MGLPPLLHTLHWLSYGPASHRRTLIGSCTTGLTFTHVTGIKWTMTHAAFPEQITRDYTATIIMSLYRNFDLNTLEESLISTHRKMVLILENPGMWLTPKWPTGRLQPSLNRNFPVFSGCGHTCPQTSSETFFRTYYAADTFAPNNAPNMLRA